MPKIQTKKYLTKNQTTSKNFSEDNIATIKAESEKPEETKSKQKTSSAKWTNSQRLQLLNAVLEQMPSLDWNLVSNKVEGKDALSCRQQWNRKLLADLKKGLIDGGT
ncbi:1509_t:CDS:1 [Ambispora leptoticha]|uniref:1509_t:CDS:1 n=1 Tax=Ambispora leptoticha TaxID=144679 RepID=A0A9N9BED4_9GLOM|nr:1509_t:CDS:1 [Ambispora leptoticha]